MKHLSQEQIDALVTTLGPELDESAYPNPPESASSSTALKERTRALVSARLDRMIPVYLQQ